MPATHIVSTCSGDSSDLIYRPKCLPLYRSRLARVCTSNTRPPARVRPCCCSSHALPRAARLRPPFPPQTRPDHDQHHRLRLVSRVPYRRHSLPPHSLRRHHRYCCRRLCAITLGPNCSRTGAALVVAGLREQRTTERWGIATAFQEHAQLHGNFGTGSYVCYHVATYLRMRCTATFAC